jgi:hypothetical protein
MERVKGHSSLDRGDVRRSVLNYVSALFMPWAAKCVRADARLTALLDLQAPSELPTGTSSTRGATRTPGQ